MYVRKVKQASISNAKKHSRSNVLCLLAASISPDRLYPERIAQSLARLILRVREESGSKRVYISRGATAYKESYILQGLSKELLV